METLSPRELELLSAYLDQELDGRQVARLEPRLKAEPSLAAALERLKETRALLRHAPQRKAPRNFTLTSAQLGIRTAAPRGWMSLNLVSAAAAALLLIVFAGDLWANGFLAAPAAATEEAMLMAAPAADAAATPEMATKENDMATEPAYGGGLEATAETLPDAPLELAPEPGERFMQQEPAPFDLRGFVQGYARMIEIVLLAIVGLASFFALRRNR